MYVCHINVNLPQFDKYIHNAVPIKSLFFFDKPILNNRKPNAKTSQESFKQRKQDRGFS